MAKTYRVLVVSAQLDSERLVYAEAVDAQEHAVQAISAESVILGSHPNILELRFYSGFASADEVDVMSSGALGGVLLIDGRSVTTGKMRARQPVLMPAIYSSDPDEPAELHPDMRFTYSLTECWDETEATLDKLSESRLLPDVGVAIRTRTRVPLESASDRVGNFLRFDRVSGWHLALHRDDSRGPSFWLRALHDGGPRPADPMMAHIRFAGGHETLHESVVPLEPRGTRISLDDRPSSFSISLFEASSGRLLCREVGAFWGAGGGVYSRTGTEATASVTDADGVVHQVAWKNWQGSMPRLLGVPWIARTSTRRAFNARARERTQVVLFEAGQEMQARQHIRELLRSLETPFLYVFDAYFDEKAAQNLLGWIHPDTKCRVLCGAGRDVVDAARKAALLGTHLAALRVGPPAREIEAKFRVVPKGLPPNGKGAQRVGCLYHDRCIIADGAAWVLGSSLNSIGSKWALIMQLRDASRLRWLFEDEWVRSPGPFQETVL